MDRDIHSKYLQSFRLPGDKQTIPFEIKATKTTGCISTATARPKLRLLLCLQCWIYLTTIYSISNNLSNRAKNGMFFNQQGRGYKNIIKSKTYFESQKVSSISLLNLCKCLNQE